MPDPRFFEDLGPVELGELAALTGARLADPSAAGRRVNAVSILANAPAESVTFVADRRYLDAASGTLAAACFVSEAGAASLPATCAALVTATPQAA
jgi:UDP-3-O-[3-hydroxymyristoyl] glucosamine N-acyltransferase